MPAEWGPHAATWLCWPHNPETWPGGLPEAEAEFRHFVEILSESETVQVLTQSPEHRARVEKQVPANVSLHVFETNDSWMRDIGPTFVQRDDGVVVAIDWTFNSWGEKYPPWDRDGATASEVARLAGVERLRPGLVLEGGALETDGEGTLLMTRSSAMGDRRNPGLTADALEKRLSPLLGVERFIWLDGALEGDDTDAHIDNLARFTSPGRVVCASERDREDPNFEALQTTRRQLREAQLEVVELPLPKPLYAGSGRLPASHANFYIANEQVLFPSFGGESDDLALGILREQFPKHRVVAIPSSHLVEGLGSLHCLSQPQPLPGR